MTSLRVATWNVHEGVPADGSDAGAGVSLWDSLIEAKPQVVALQEVPFPENGKPDRVAEVAERAGMPYLATLPLSASSFNDDEMAGLALLSHYPLLDVEHVWLPNPRLRTRTSSGRVMDTHDKGLLSAVIEWEGGKTQVVSLHSFPFHRFGRAAEEAEFTPVWMGLAQSMSPMSGRPLVVCGDFNTERRELLTGQLDVQRAIVGTATHRDLAVDDILYSGDLDLVDSQVIATSSDHALCVAEFRPSPGR